MVDIAKLKEGKMPRSIGIIMDGNRRLAKRFGEDPWKGHEFGVKKVHRVLDWCEELGIKYITLYAFSTENFNRPKEEFEMIMNLFQNEFDEIAHNKEHRSHRSETRVRVIGRRGKIPEKVMKSIKKAEDATKHYNNFFLNVAIAYGGQQEITDACKNITEGVREGNINPGNIDKDMVAENLYFEGDFPYPDLIIRTGGEKRLSNFLLWESAYSELFFVDQMWPEFEKERFLEVIEDFQNRKRRFGR
ncbi:MAG: polyprenyl diphosphate synthase [Candidatus Aenigmatarchaeota archaeon]